MIRGLRDGDAAELARLQRASIAALGPQAYSPELETFIGLAMLAQGFTCPSAVL